MKGLTYEEIIQKNPRERLKKEKHPLDIIKELEEIIRKGYEEVPEEDLVRLQWYGLYHDKPRVGTFCLRIKIPGGELTPLQLITIGKLAEKFGNSAEITVRQDIQLHKVKLEDLPEVFEELKRVGLFRPGACGDTVRNITCCPLSGIDPQEPFEALPYVKTLSEYFSSSENREFFDLPRKFKITVTCCPYHCTSPELNDLSFIGLIKDGAPHFAIFVGGGLSSTPRLSRFLGIAVPPDRILETAKAIVEIWSEDPENRKSFVKARFKYMVDRLGTEGIRERLIDKLSFDPVEIEEEPRSRGVNFHYGVGKQKQEGMFFLHVPVITGRIEGSLLRKIGQLAGEEGFIVRTTPRQNLLLGNIPEERLEEVKKKLKEWGIEVESSPSRALSVACTSDPYCNYSVGSAKETLIEILDFLEKEFGNLGDTLIGCDGCPHACSHHWLSDIGLQATHIRKPDGSVESGLNIVLGGRYSQNPKLGKILVKRASLSQTKEYLRRLFNAYRNSQFSSLREFIASKTPEELLSIMGAQQKEREKGIKVKVMGPLAKITAGVQEHNVKAGTVLEIIEALDRKFLGFKAKVMKGDELKSAINVFVNGEDIKYLKGLQTPVKEGDEVQFILALAGGKGNEV